MIWFTHVMGVRGPDCADLVQEVFLAAVRQGRAGNFKQNSSVITWLDGILKHKIKDLWRSLNRYRRLFIQVEAENEDGESNPEYNISLSRRWDEDMDVQAVLNRIPADLRVILLLNEIEGLTLREISQKLNSPPGTIGRKLAAAKQIIRLELDNVLGARSDLGTI